MKVPSVRLCNGRDMPMIGIGTRKGSASEVKFCLNAALESGYRHIDTAYQYQNETPIGEVLKEWITSGRLKREDLFITSKLPAMGNREKDVTRFLQMSLNMLGVSYVDLYLVHMPIGLLSEDDNATVPRDEQGNVILDFETNLEGTWKAMEAQVDAGYVKAIGISNFNSVQIERIMKVARIKPAILQIEVHAYHMQHALRAVCEKHGISVCAYAPLGAADRKEGTLEYPHLVKHPLVAKIAEARGKTTAQILLRHLIEHGLIVIPHSSKAEHIKQNFQVFDFTLSHDEMEKLDSLDRGGAGRLFTFVGLTGDWNRLPASIFPPVYDLNAFKRGVSRRLCNRN